MKEKIMDNFSFIRQMFKQWSKNELVTIRQKMAIGATVGAIIAWGIYKEFSHHKVSTPIGVVRSDHNTDIVSHPEYYVTDKVSIENVKSAISTLDDAYLFLSKSDEFRVMYRNREDVYHLLPLMIKESLLDQSRISRTWAVGLFQMKPDAIQDAKKALTKNLWISSDWINPNKSRDNAILGIIYFSYINPKLLNDKLHIEDQKDMIDQEFYYMSYNGWAYRVAGMLQKYQEEHSTKTYPDWESFAQWAAKKIDIHSAPTKKHSLVYNTDYTNWFSQSFTGDKRLIPFSSKVETKVEKIQEMIDYVEGIDAIANTDQSSQSWTDEEVTSYNEARLPYNQSLDVFHGAGPKDRITYYLKQQFGITNNYDQVASIPWKWVRAMLDTAGIDPTKENVEEFYDLNDLDESDPIVRNVRYLLPAIKEKTEELKIPEWDDILTDLSVPADVFIQKTKPDFYTWLESLPVEDHMLRWKLIILDPWHGGRDPWTSPVAYDGNGNPISYLQSDLKPLGKWGEWADVPNWLWDKNLHVIEANLSMDVTLRIAREIRKHGGEVKITHFSRDQIDETNWWWSKNKKMPGLKDDIEKWDTWGDGSGKFDQWANYWVIKRAKLRNQWKNSRSSNDVLFLSIHADARPGDHQSIPLNVLTMKNTGAMNQFAWAFAQSIGSVRWFTATAEATYRLIHVLKPIKWADTQNVLIELGNSWSPNTSYTFRFAKNRQEYADAITRGILWTLPKS